MTGTGEAECQLRIPSPRIDQSQSDILFLASLVYSFTGAIAVNQYYLQMHRYSSCRLRLIGLTFVIIAWDIGGVGSDRLQA